MARASVVLPLPSSPCSPTTSPGRRRAASVAPSRSVAVSSARDMEKAGIFRCRPFSMCPPVGGYAPCSCSVAGEVALEGPGLGHADILGLVGPQLGGLGADLLAMERRALLVGDRGQPV